MTNSAVSRGTNTLAIVSLCAAIASWVVAPGLASLVAVITGHMARRQIRETGEEGDSMATIGLVLGYINLALSALGLLLFIVALLAGISWSVLSL